MQEQTGFHPSDVCGIDLESLICRGHVLIARVLQISNDIPPCFWYDYTVQQHSVASLKGREKEGVLSTMWKKMISKKTNVKLLRRQALSYAKQDLKDTCSEQHQQPNAATKEIAPSTDATDPHGSSKERYKSILADFAYLADPERYDSHLHILQGEELDEDRRKLIIQQE